MNQCLLANTVTSLFGHLFFMVPLVWIVILIEMIFIKKATQGSTIRAFGSCTVANLVSTFVGIPVTWILSFFISIPSLYSVSVILDKFFPGLENNTSLLLSLMFGQSVPSRTPGHVEMFATIFLLIPYYYMTVVIEYPLIRYFFRKVEPQRIKKTVIRMNRVTYFLLGGLMLAVFVIGELMDR
ncbi:MAG: hypothetical protein GX455_11370 [Phycisphaerae bacterium]|nr:hypothetical protein [Phycisphaerae bacterium]